MIFSGIFEKLPKLRVAFAHGGGSFPATIGRIEQGFTCRPDLVAKDNNINPRDYLGKFWIDSLVHDPKMLQYVVELMGSNRVCLGTDYPFPLGEFDPTGNIWEPGRLIKSMSLNPDMTSQLLGAAALEWLGTESDQFT